MAKQSRDQSTTFSGKTPTDPGNDSTKFNDGEPSGAQDRLSGGAWKPLTTSPTTKE